MKTLSIDRNKRLREEPHTGHNRWHPDIAPIITVDPGEPLTLETRDASDNQIHPAMTVEELPFIDGKVSHPLTGPVHINGARPGDLLEVEFMDIRPHHCGWSLFRPTTGLLREYFPHFYLVHWTLADGWATSPDLPGVRIPEGSMMGISGVAPSHDQLREWTRREQELLDKGGNVMPPTPEDAVALKDHVRREGLRTIPPRENGGNMDIKHLTKGARLFLPVNVEGALFSTGDAHFYQGDSECCLTAIEMQATVTVRFHLHPGKAAREKIIWPRFSHPGYFNAPQWAVPQDFIATMGLPIHPMGIQGDEDHITLAAKNAILNMIDLLEHRGFTRDQAYIICSVAADLKISSVVNLPNVLVSALLPERIFI